MKTQKTKTTNRISLIFLLVLFLLYQSCQQDIFVGTYGINSSELVTAIDKVGGDEFYVSGKMSSPGRLYVMRADNNGGVKWAKTYALGPNSFPTDISSTNDGGCIIIGQGFTDIDKFFVIKLKDDGQEEWKRQVRYPGLSGSVMAKNVIQLEGGIGYAIVGSIQEGGAYTPLLARFDNMGGSPQFRRYPAGGYYGSEIKQNVGEDELVIVGEGTSGLQTMMIGVDDGAGQFNWGKEYQNTSGPAIYGLGLHVADDGIAVSGHTNEFGNANPFLIKADFDGNYSWAKKYTIPGAHDHCTLTGTDGGGYAISGVAVNGMFLLHTDPGGVPHWYHRYVDNYGVIPSNFNTGHGSHTAVQLSDKGFGLAASDFIPPGSNGSATIIRTNSDGNSACDQMSIIPDVNDLVIDEEDLMLAAETINLIVEEPMAPQSSVNFKVDFACKQNNCISPPSDLTAWYPLGLSGYDYDLVSGNLASPGGGALTSTAGKVGLAYDFNGSSHYLVAPSSPGLNFGTGDFSIDFWINLGNSASGQQTILCKKDGTGKGYCLSLNGNQLEFELDDGSSSAAFSLSDGPIPLDNQWHLVVLTVDRSVADGGKLYIDGGEVDGFDPTVQNNSLSNNSPLYIGKHSTLNQFFGKYLDELEFFNRALSDWEVQRLYIAAGSGKCYNAAYAPENSGFCLSDVSIQVGITVCNYSSSDHTYTLESLDGLPAGSDGGACDVDGPISYTPTTTSLTLNPASCGVFLIDISRPVGLNTPGYTACYQASFSDEDGNKFWTKGSVFDASSICLKMQEGDRPVSPLVLAPGQEREIAIQLENRSDRIIYSRITRPSTKVEVACHDAKYDRILTDSLAIPANEKVAIPLRVKMKSGLSFEPQKILFEASQADGKDFHPIGEIQVISVAKRKRKQ